MINSTVRAKVSSAAAPPVKCPVSSSMPRGRLHCVCPAARMAVSICRARPETSQSPGRTHKRPSIRARASRAFTATAGGVWLNREQSRGGARDREAAGRSQRPIGQARNEVAGFPLIFDRHRTLQQFCYTATHESQCHHHQPRRDHAPGQTASGSWTEGRRPFDRRNHAGRIAAALAVTLPMEMYTAERVREFDAAEQELAAYLGAKALAVKRAGRPKRKSAR